MLQRNKETPSRSSCFVRRESRYKRAPFVHVRFRSFICITADLTFCNSCPSNVRVCAGAAKGSQGAFTWPASHPLPGMEEGGGKEKAQYTEVEEEASGEEDGIDGEDEDDAEVEEEDEEEEYEEEDDESSDDWDDYFDDAEDEDGEAKRGPARFRTLGTRGAFSSAPSFWDSAEAASAPEPFSGTGVTLGTDQGILTDEERRRRMLLARERAQQELSEKAAAKVNTRFHAHHFSVPTHPPSPCFWQPA